MYWTNPKVKQKLAWAYQNDLRDGALTETEVNSERKSRINQIKKIWESVKIIIDLIHCKEISEVMIHHVKSI